MPGSHPPGLQDTSYFSPAMRLLNVDVYPSITIGCSQIGVSEKMFYNILINYLII